MGTHAYTTATQGQIRRVVPDLLHSRALARALFWKDVRVRYRNAAIGFAWALLHPLSMTLILYFVFGYLFELRLREAGAPAGTAYAVSILCALIPWQFFSGGLTAATNSLIENQALIKKVYFPREIIPITAMGNAFITLLVGLALVVAAYGLVVGLPGVWTLAWAGIFAIQLALMLGLAFLLSCAQVHSRDVQFLVEVLLMFGFYASPVFYTLEIVRDSSFPPWVVQAYSMNPMAGLLTAYRQTLFENRPPDLELLIWPVGVSLAVLLVGVTVFRKQAPTIADHL